MPHTIGGMMVCRPAPISLPCNLSLLSDVHLGPPNFDEACFKRVLKRAQMDGDRLAINGDLFDLILSKDAKRYEPSCIAKRFQGSNDLINRVVDYAVELLAPVANQLDMIGCGNHETAVEKHHSVDPISLLIERLSHYTSSDHLIHHGAYSGFLRYAVKREQQPFTIFYWHGAGGGAGIGGSATELLNRCPVQNVDAVWYAHRHVKMASQIERLACPQTGSKIKVKPVWLLRTGGFLQPYGGQSQDHIRQHGRKSNYAADALHTPYGRGGLRLRLFKEDDLPGIQSCVELFAH